MKAVKNAQDTRATSARPPGNQPMSACTLDQALWRLAVAENRTSKVNSGIVNRVGVLPDDTSR